MATMSLPNVLSRLGGGTAVSTSICLFRFDGFGLHLSQSMGVYGVDESLHVHVEYLRRLGLGADVGQIQTIAANQRRQELVREHPLRVVRV